jgi:hypothetical protein
MESTDPIQELWEHLLSQDREMILSAFSSLDAAEREAVSAHLLKMSLEAGWHPLQKQAAATALEVISSA